MRPTRFASMALMFCPEVPAMAAQACIGATDPQRSTPPTSRLNGTKVDDFTMSAQAHNVGVYYLDEVTGVVTLIESYYDPDAASWAFNAGYVLQSVDSFAGVQGRSVNTIQGCVDEGQVLPEMTVHAYVPSLFHGGVFLRVLGLFGWGGSGVNTVRIGGQATGSVDYTCDTDEVLRLAEANVHALAVVLGARRGYDFVMIMPDGQKEHWTYMCGGLRCGPTVLDVTPRISPCN